VHAEVIMLHIFDDDHSTLVNRSRVGFQVKAQGE
jgi:hypothetical protein